MAHHAVMAIPASYEARSTDDLLWTYRRAAADAAGEDDPAFRVIFLAIQQDALEELQRRAVELPADVPPPPRHSDSPERERRRVSPGVLAGAVRRFWPF